MSFTRAEPNVNCPRCGYDQRGAMATWKQSCPLQGTCTECGLTYDWVDLIKPYRLEPAWNVEYARGLGMIKSMCTTALLQLLPWVFWRKLSMHHQPRFFRIVVYLLLLLPTLYGAFMVSQGVAARNEYHYRPIGPFGTQPQTAPCGSCISELHAVTWSSLLPFSSISPGMHSPFTRFPAPIELVETYWLDPYSGGSESLRLAGMISMFWLSWIVLMPLAFALLPQTRRKVKVRWNHILRIALYGTAFTVPLLWAFAFWHVTTPVLLPIAIMFTITLVWWGFSCRVYLRLPHAWFVAATLTFMLLLVPIVLQYYLFNDIFVRAIL